MKQNERWILCINLKTKEQFSLLAYEHETIALLEAIAQVMKPDIVQLCHKNLLRNIPVQDFLKFCR